MFPRLLLISVFVVFGTMAFAQDCPQNRKWPTQIWTTKNATVTEDLTRTTLELEEYAFKLEGSDIERVGVRTDGVVILKGGQIIYERYGRGFNKEMKHLSWSISKSVTAILLGRAIQLGKMSLTDSICAFLKNLPIENCAITIQHVLEFGTGLDWNEIYEDESNQASSVLAMLYGVGHHDMMNFVATHPLRSPPGKVFNYSTGDAVLLSGLVGKALMPEHGVNFPWALLFDPLGIKTAALEKDAAGTYIGGSYFYASPRDLARIGYLMMTDGCWNNQRLLPANWVSESTQVSEVYSTEHYEVEKNVQGRHWWLNQAVPKMKVEIPWKDVPDDAFSALGHWGQLITIIPSKDLIIVRTGDDRDKSFDKNIFLSLAVALGDAS